MTSNTPSSAPIVRAARVERTPVDAFRIFTDEIGAWWPLPTHGAFGARSGGLAFVDGRLVELATDGSEAVWGHVTVWDPPHRLAFTWHPGRAEDDGSEVEIEFIADGTGTRVILEHRGWEAFGTEGVARRRNHIGPNAWGFVLDHFADVTEPVAGAADLDGLTLAAASFFDEAAAGGFGPPLPGEWTAEQVIAHVTLNDAAMLAVCQGIVHGTEVSFDNAVCQDVSVLDSWIERHDDIDQLIDAGRRIAAQFRCALARLSPEQQGVEVPCRLQNAGVVVLDDNRPWGSLAIDIQSMMHLPAHTEQLAQLRGDNAG